MHLSVDDAQQAADYVLWMLCGSPTVQYKHKIPNQQTGDTHSNTVIAINVYTLENETKRNELKQQQQQQ